MVRIQLHLTERQDRRLKALAKARHLSRAELIRRGIELVLQEESPEADPLLELIGTAGPAGRSDVSERHDDVLYSYSDQPLPLPLPMAADKERE